MFTKPVNFIWSKNEKGYRSVVKSITWRFIGTIDTIIISWIVVGDFRFAVSIGGIELFTKMFLYFFHERLWSRSNFGIVRDNKIEYEI